MHRPCSVNCLLPPNVLESVIRNGSAEQRDWALGSLQRDQMVRTARIQNANVRAGGPREGADALAVRATIAKDRIIHDAGGEENVRGPVVRREGDPDVKNDQAVDQAYDGLGATFDFFETAFQRNSIDDSGMPLRAVVHYGEAYANAFWDGRRMVFGDGDGELFSCLTGSLDVIGHELGHGVTEDEADLEYLGQPGALNESLSDVWGSLVKQYHLRQTVEQADWLLGKDVFSPSIGGDALRSMKAPGTAYDHELLGKDDQPAHMKDYVVTSRDHGGVHTNSGIPNHAFYTTAMELGGHAWEKAGRIWYAAVQHPLVRARTDFAGFAGATLNVAARLYGAKSAEVKAVQAGWNKVGVPAAG